MQIRISFFTEKCNKITWIICLDNDGSRLFPCKGIKAPPRVFGIIIFWMCCFCCYINENFSVAISWSSTIKITNFSSYISKSSLKLPKIYSSSKNFCETQTKTRWKFSSSLYIGNCNFFAFTYAFAPRIKFPSIL
jgi:hypothetical protein